MIRFIDSSSRFLCKKNIAHIAYSFFHIKSVKISYESFLFDTGVSKIYFEYVVFTQVY